ncbi:putative crossover junction endonuclease EME2 [Scleropages formosus]|uniref:Putative crossover junction endonuclease EME2 n=1 Tax=Scleropages formosus TaxID=113540 RepID=A0A0P7UHN6_SCLFO|nr:putative crossover junction endonuclease EME2 [Scleropages formosus]
MARLRRANTWEISDSERESGSELVAAVRGSASGDGMVSFLGGGTAGPSPAKKKRRRQMEADRGGTREERRRERARIEEEKRREKQRRREAAERVRSYRPEACLRSFTVCVDPGVRGVCATSLVQNEEIDLLLGTLSSLEWKSAIEEQHLTHSITWRRALPKALVFLQLYKNVCVMFLESWQDLTDHVCAITKALSKRPMKRLTEEPSLPFCVEGSWASGVRVGKDGCGLQQVWSRQVQQLNRVSRSVAVAVTTAFPSPQMLLQAYKDSHSEAERKGLLADLPVKSDERERRVGPEISSRLYRLLTSYNPQLVLD